MATARARATMTAAAATTITSMKVKHTTEQLTRAKITTIMTTEKYFVCKLKRGHMIGVN